MHAQHRCTSCGSGGHNSRSCPGGATEGLPVLAEEGPAMAAQPVQSYGNVSSESESEAEHSVQRKERKRGGCDLWISASAVKKVFWTLQQASIHTCCRPCRKRLEHSRTWAVSCRAEEAWEGKSRLPGHTVLVNLRHSLGWDCIVARSLACIARRSHSAIWSLI